MKRSRFLILFAALVLVAAACGGDDSGDDTTTTTAGDTGATTTTVDGGMAGQGGNITILMWQAATALNPYLSGGTKEIMAASLVIEPLAEITPDGELVPKLAADIPTVENGGVSEDLLSITWTLKDTVWSDGTPVTADDVVFSYEYCIDEATGCTQSSLYAGIDSVEAVDSQTAKVNFSSPTPYPYSPFVTGQAPIIQKAQFENCIGAAAAGCTDANFGPIGTGPFMVREFRTNDTAVYDYNPNYRGNAEGQPFFGEVLIKGGGDADATARSVLQLDEADYAWNVQVDPVVLADLESNGLGTVMSGFATLVERIMINQTNPDADLGDLRSVYDDGNNPHPFLTNPDIVKAMSMAIDRQTLVDVGYGAAGRPTCNVWPAPPADSTNNDDCLVQDIDGANALLDSIGAVDSDGDGVREFNGTPLSVLYQTSTNAVRQSNQDLVKAWWEEIGIETELKNIDASVFFGGDPASPDTYQKFYADLQMYANNSGSPDPQGYMGNWITAQMPSPENNFGGQNIQRYANPDYDALWEQLAAEGDLNKRAEITIQLNDLLVQDGSIIPLIWRGDTAAVSNEIQGIGDSLNGWDTQFWNIHEWSRAG
ncbi:MAG: peptide ABC transporter substrate-binding protein [Acidimicrobiia bacterium]|nr:peptide ABC transporter substrate-binding protein [Acidimicrobiia bacterium]